MSRGVQVSRTGGDEPVWSPRGDELFYRRGAQLLAVPFAAGVPGSPTVLFEGRFETDRYNNDATNYDVTSDGGASSWCSAWASATARSSSSTSCWAGTRC